MQNSIFLGKDGRDGSLANGCLGIEIIQAVCLLTLHYWRESTESCLQMPPDLHLSLLVSLGPLKLWVFQPTSQGPQLLPAFQAASSTPARDIPVRQSPSAVLHTHHHRSSSCVLMRRSAHLVGPQFPPV